MPRWGKTPSFPQILPPFTRTTGYYFVEPFRDGPRLSLQALCAIGRVYHPDFDFSSSIKAAAPALCPDVTYEDL